MEAPIFAFTIKDLKGTEITGTNSLFENALPIRYLKGETVVIEFSQRLNMASGQYLLSLGCTGFQGDQFVVYQRLYDILCFEVISYKRFVGLYDLKSQVKIEKNRGKKIDSMINEAFYGVTIYTPMVILKRKFSTW